MTATSRLSIRGCFSKLHEMEAQYCRLVRAMLAKRREARPRNGVGITAGHGRAPAGKVLLRVMIGGALDPHAVDLEEAGLLAAVRSDLELTMGLRLSPEFVHVVRHRRGIPQYTMGHGTRVARIERALAGQPGLFLAGNSYRGVSVSACIEDAGRVAKDVAAHLAVIDTQGHHAVAR